MTAGGNPWADPATVTWPGPPYAGPPQAAPPYGHHPYGLPVHGQPPYGRPPSYGAPMPWGPLPPRGPLRPGQVIAAAVIAFVQAALVLIASLYVWFFASIADFAAGEAGVAPAHLGGLASEGTVLAKLGLCSAALLVIGGVLALNQRARAVWSVLVTAHVVQVVLALSWGLRLHTALIDIPGAQGAFAGLAAFFAAGPLAALGLLLVGGGRTWFGGARRASGTAAG